MQTTSLTSTASSSTDGLRVVERSRGTCHPQAARPTTRDRVARSLLLRPDPATPAYVRR